MTDHARYGTVFNMWLRLRSFICGAFYWSFLYIEKTIDTVMFTLPQRWCCHDRKSADGDDEEKSRQYLSSCCSLNRFLSVRVIITCAVTLFVIVIAAVGEYIFLDSLYLVDEVYDSDHPRELTFGEKITIR